MKVTAAIDSFKGSLSSISAGAAVSEGIKRVFDDAQVTVCPMADGGEGTTDAIIAAMNGEYVSAVVSDPLGRPIKCRYGILRKASHMTAVIEMSAAAGITLISENLRNPLYTTTYGVGEMILDALSRGCRRFIIGIGGSATNDGGVGMLSALGFGFTDADGNRIKNGAAYLAQLSHIDIGGADKRLCECSFVAACDVKNILCGPFGCSAVYGPQKGATPEMIKDMDAYLENYARLTKEVLPDSDKDLPGTGAAGGMGFALVSYLGAKLVSGSELVMKETELEEHIRSCDIVVTGEGRLDGQSCMGKAPTEVAALAKKYSKPVIAFCGCVGDGAELCNRHGIDAFFPILRTPCTPEQAMDENNAYENLCAAAEQVFRALRVSAVLSKK